MAYIALQASKEETPSERGRRPPDELSLLMIRSQGGDKASYAKLLVECRTIIAAVAQNAGLTGIVRDQIIIETLLTLHRARNTFDGSKPFADWLTSIAHRHTLLRRERLRHDAPSPLGKAASHIYSWFNWAHA